jgi:hypothetical protein
MDTMKIICALSNVKSFLGVFPSDLIPNSITRSGTFIINADPYTEQGSHCLAILLQPKAYNCYYFDSYGLTLFLPDIHYFLRHNCVLWDHNKVQLQGLTSDVFGHYCCLFALYMERGFTPRHFVGLFDAANADRRVRQQFASEFGQLSNEVCGGQSFSDFYKR